MRTLLVALLAAAGCHSGLPGGQPQQPGVTPGPSSTLTFNPSMITFTRIPSTCGVQNPPFTDGDLYSLSLLGPDGGPGAPPGRTGILTSFHRTVELDQDLAIAMMPFGIIGSFTDASGQTTNFYGQNGQRDNYQITLQWHQGPNPNEVDSHPVSSATLNFAALPQQDGDLVSLRVDLGFDDGALLDLVVREPLVSESIGCPAG